MLFNLKRGINRMYMKKKPDWRWKSTYDKRLDSTLLKWRCFKLHYNPRSPQACQLKYCLTSSYTFTRETWDAAGAVGHDVYAWRDRSACKLH